jgi:hypothetical protein
LHELPVFHGLACRAPAGGKGGLSPEYRFPPPVPPVLASGPACH